MTTGLVLLHGGATSAKHWDWVVDAASTPSLAVNVPGRGDRPADLETIALDEACDSVARDVASFDPAHLVLVVHSSGGLFVPGLVARLRDRIRHVVLIAASVTPDGGSGMDTMKPAHAEGLRMQWAAAAENGSSIRTPAEPPAAERIRTAWGTVLNDEQIEFVRDPSRWISDTTNFYRAELRWDDVRTLPVTYVLTVRDRAVPPAMQEAMVARLPHAAVVPLDTGHVPAVTMPGVLAALLDGIAADVERRIASETAG